MPVLPRPVTEVPPAAPPAAREHFARLLSFETDCWDVHAALNSAGDPGFVLLDTRAPASFGAGHLPGAHNLPTRRISRRTLEPFGEVPLFVVYCAGPHCNGADRAALRLAELDRPVKKMIGGVTGWLDEGFSLTTAS